MPAPTITGTVSSLATTSETPLDPFSGVTIGDANGGATDALSITLSGPGALSGTGLSVSSGIYTLTGTAAAITSELRALSFTPVDVVPNTSVTTTFTLSDTSSAYGVDTYNSQVSTLATFTGANGASPLSYLASDAAGDLFGVTGTGGADNDGTVFEIAKSTGALTTVASFTGANGADPWGVTSDAAGDLFGTTANGGADGDGTVFEIAKSTGELTTLATFTGTNGENPFGTVISDAAGDLFGTTAYGGAGGYGTVFEIAKSTGELTTLATFTGANGETPAGSLTIDAEGDLFGTTANGGADGDGTVFEIAESTGKLTTLATFTGSNGEYPERGLTIDAAGDLFGTTFHGGADNDGTVFEIVKSTGALITLATFTGANGASPLSALVIDAAGDLFGTTELGGADNDGTAFEIAKSTGLLSTLATFTGANGEELDGGLTINPAGDLFGTTYYGGANDHGTVFELPATFVATPIVDDTTTVTVTDSDPVVAPTITGTVSSQATTSETPLDPFSGVTIGDANAGATDALSITLSGPGALSGTGLSVSSGIYTLTGTAAAITSELRALSFTPVDVVPNTSVTTTFTLSDTSSAVSQLPVVATTAVTDSDPVVTPEVIGGASVSYVAGASPVALDAGLALADAAAVSLSAATVSISAGFVLGDTLSVGSPQTGIVSQYNAATGVLTLSGWASLAAYETELDSITYASANATTSTRTITWSVNDGVNASAPVTSSVSVSRIVPVVTAGASVSYVAGASPVALDAGLAVADAAANNLSAATVSISAGFVQGDTLSVGSPQTGIASQYNAATGVLTLSGAATLATYQTELDSITYASPNATPSSRTITWSVNDGVNPSASATSQVGSPPTTPNNSEPNIMLQSTSGQLALWQANGVTISASGLLGPNPGPSWSEMGAGDFFSGDTSDILWQNTNGAVGIWQMQNGAFVSSDVVASPGPSWRIEGTGDFNGDGKTDIVLQSTNGDVAVWEMNGAGQISQAAEVANPGPSWQVVGTGDFNQDAKADILLQNSNGQLAIWDMNGDQISQAGVVNANPGPTWHAVGTGDFYGDGQTDILFQNNDGTVAVWDMNGDQISQAGVVADPGPAWHVVGTGDFNNDGKTDIVLQNNNGAVAVWDMNGSTVSQAGVLANPGPTWSVVGGHIG